MSKSKTPKANALTLIEQGFSRLNWFLVISLLLSMGAVAGIFYGWFGIVQNQPASAWILSLVITFIFLLMFGIGTVLFAGRIRNRTVRRAKVALNEEWHDLRTASNRAKSLQQMASTMSATLSFERVMEVALDVSSLALEEMGVPPDSLVGTVFLYEGDNMLIPVAARRLGGRDLERSVKGDAGIIGSALKNAEPTITSKPNQDPELKNFLSFQACQTAVCIPLRAGFQIFGVMVIGSEFDVQFNHDHYELFNAVADQVVIALQNAQLFQQLQSEKARMIAADEDARKELARNLHDGPTQSIAAIAMHINFIKSLMVKDPRQALNELNKVEKLAKDTSREIRSMLFALRPLVLETDGLGAAIETMMDKLRESDNLNLRLTGSDYGNIIQPQAQGVVFSIVEEAVGNARKYSRANLIEIKFWQEGDLFVARVQDDGAGFDVKSVMSNYSSRGSLGMVNMKERAERIDGSIRIDSAPGKGTTVTLVVPLDKQGSHLSQNGIRS
jgi:signal transduction histidine kinase